MITHFQFKSLYEHQEIPGWRFSFYFDKVKYLGTYLPDGTIEWTTPPASENKEIITKQVHEIMTFHVYDH
ncbi:DUF5342 family protein [Robertmurraya massiliosenegalensis]|uniref:DUF5342 family protein n=1 Tax=Robertmurraya massiliosenegalensis TaxID=1287657 RepID=UPI00031A34D8|nr:DUF5342 family protein [Robertmurraya massiliosenegalensis]